MKLHQNLKIPTPMCPSQNQLSGASFGSEKYLRMQKLWPKNQQDLQNRTEGVQGRADDAVLMSAFYAIKFDGLQAVAAKKRCHVAATWQCHMDAMWQEE